MSTKKSTKKQISKQDLQLLFTAINQEGVGEDARTFITQYVDDVITATLLSDYAYNEELFMRYFPEGWKNSYEYARRNVLDIIKGLKAGKTIDEIHAGFERERVEGLKRREEEERNKPEPKNWLSDEWRYWKLGRLEQKFASDDPQVFGAAFREFKALLRDLSQNEDFYHTYPVRVLIPHLICIRQDIATLNGQPSEARRKPAYFKKGGTQ
jgi:hypothetical protein